MVRTRSLVSFVVSSFAVALGSRLPAQLDWQWAGVMEPQSTGAMAYDAARGELLLYGIGAFGRTDPAVTDTWVWTGTDWQPRVVSTSPPPRDFPGIAYDVVRQRVVLFGGQDPTTRAPRDDTWEWDGVRWAEVTPATTRPCARSMVAMGWDGTTNRVILHGGLDATFGTQLADTWAWTGSDWVDVSPVMNPTPRYDHEIEWDPVRGQVVLFGGRAPVGSAALGDTWLWDGATWTRASASGPTATFGHALAWDGNRNTIVLVSQQGVWDWDGSSWTAAPSPIATPTFAQIAAWDAGRGHVVFTDSGSFRSGARVVVREAAGWRELFDGVVPAIQAPVTGVYDEARGRFVVFAGRIGGPVVGGVWEHDGARWLSRPTAGGPSSRVSFRMVWQPTNGKTLLFGGNQTGGPFDETWEWDGSTWTLLNPATRPSGRYHFGIAFDRARGVVVLFGGVTAAGDVAETWEFDGVTWREVVTSNAPAPRRRAELAWDGERERVVLFGGRTAAGLVGDTWTYDGVDWTQEQPNGVTPAPRARHAMTWDADRRRVLMFGGSLDPVIDDELWEWDGAEWTRRDDPTGVAPIPAAGHALVYDPGRRVAWMWGGTSVPYLWRLAPTARGFAAEYGTGCAGTHGVPTLGSVGGPLVGSRDFGLELRGAVASATALLGLAASPAQVSFGACTFLAFPPWVEVVGTTTAAGARTWSVPIPDDPSLRGTDVFAQAFVLDPGGSFQNFAAFTAGVQVRIGD